MTEANQSNSLISISKQISSKQQLKTTMTVHYMDSRSHQFTLVNLGLKRKSSASSFDATAPAAKKMALSQPLRKQPQQQLKQQVRFNDDENQCHLIDNYASDEETKAQIWYSRDECRRFRDEIWVSSFRLISSVPKALAEEWVEVLTEVYTHSRTTIHSPSASSDLEAKLIQVYMQTNQQADDFVGLEFNLLCPPLKDDVASRKRSLQGIVQLKNSFLSGEGAGPFFTEAQLQVMSRQLTRVSTRFAQQIASAQAKASAILNESSSSSSTA